MAEDRLSGQQMLTFSCNGVMYGFDIKAVTDIIEIPELTKLPMVADYVLGVMNLRGKVVPVIDFAGRMGFEAPEYDDHSCIVVIDCDGAALGVKVPRVVDAETYDPDAVSLSPVAGSCVRGYLELGGRRITVIDQVKLGR